MLNNYSSAHHYLHTGGNTYNPYTVTKVYPVYLGEKAGTERVVLFSSKKFRESKAEIQNFKNESNKWITNYTKKFKGISRLDVISGYWQITQKNVVVIFYRQVSGNYLDYYVIGKKNNKIHEYAERTQIFEGNVWFEGGKLIEAYGNRYRSWTRQKGTLSLSSYKLPMIPGSKIIEYKITPDEKVIIDKKNHTVKAGDFVQVLRTDTNSIVERVIYYLTPVMKYIPQRSAFKTLKKGKIKFTIIPCGYNWKNSVIVTVDAE